MITTVADSKVKDLRKPGKIPSSRRPDPIFRINFSRNNFISDVVRKNTVYGVIIYLIAHLIISLVMAGAAADTGRRFHHLASSLEAKLPESVKIEELNAQMGGLYQELSERGRFMGIFIRLGQDRFAAAGKLAALARTLPAKTWLTKVHGSKSDKSLKVDALYYIAPDEPFELPVNAWMEKLKQDPVFSEGLLKIELKKSAQERKGTAELQMFEIEARWQ